MGVAVEIKIDDQFQNVPKGNQPRGRGFSNANGGGGGGEGGGAGWLLITQSNFFLNFYPLEHYQFDDRNLNFALISAAGPETARYQTIFRSSG